MKLSRRPVKEKRNRYVKDVRELLKTAGANAVGALLVLLDLLEGQSQSVRQPRLRKVEHKSSHADASTHVAVYRVQPLVHSRPLNGNNVGRRRNVSTTFVNVTPYHTNRIRHLFKGISILSVARRLPTSRRPQPPTLGTFIIPELCGRSQ
jgi:hypothetical protein